MELKLQDLRRYAIDNRVEIKFGDAETGGQCLINAKGQVKIPDENKELRVEEALEAASSFELIGVGKPRQLSRDALAGLIGESFNRRGVAVASKDEE